MENHEQVEFSWFSSLDFEMMMRRCLRNEKVGSFDLQKKRREQI
jgi:hypothetical protein